jgi:multidrug efflux pump subunit AcrA (membrane-fusion protein)
VWVQAEFYEQDAPLVRAGDGAELTVNSYPERRWRGTIDYIYPSVDPQTRTLRARLRFRNHGVMLKPGMYANVTIEKALGYRLTVPEEAVLDSGTRQIVFLDRGDGHFEPREVKVGQRVDGRREILSGVSEGDLVVTSGNFLIDSESRLKAALRGMEEMPGMPGMDHKPGTNAAGGTQPGAAPSTGSGQVVPDEGSKPMEMPESPPPAPPAGHAGHGM